ncbi:MAG: immune inhibitor A, partial [Chloroflexi bacterium]|nr:immune inhibitor A [Chloroflexota bacterium]
MHTTRGGNLHAGVSARLRALSLAGLLLLMVGFLTATPATANASSGWELILDRPTFNFNGIDFVSEREGWMTAGAGLLHTTDGGATWTEAAKISVGVVDFADRDHGWAAGVSGTIYTTTDGGQTWEALPGRHTTEFDPVALAYGPGYSGSSDGEWVQEEIDLTPYAGGEVLLRFEYVTDDATHERGFAVDDIEIPELAFADGADAENGWQAEGFRRIEGPLPQRFLVQLIEQGAVSFRGAVRKLYQQRLDTVEGEGHDERYHDDQHNRRDRQDIADAQGIVESDDQSN